MHIRSGAQQQAADSMQEQRPGGAHPMVPSAVRPNTAPTAVTTCVPNRGRPGSGGSCQRTAGCHPTAQQRAQQPCAAAAPMAHGSGRMPAAQLPVLPLCCTRSLPTWVTPLKSSGVRVSGLVISTPASMNKMPLPPASALRAPAPSATVPVVGPAKRGGRGTGDKHTTLPPAAAGAALPYTPHLLQCGQLQHARRLAACWPFAKL